MTKFSSLFIINSRINFPGNHRPWINEAFDNKVYQVTMLKSLVTVTQVIECVPKNFARVLLYRTLPRHDVYMAIP